MEIPLFPLHTVLCPGIVLPLHIFEERYRALVRHCLDTGHAVRGRPHQGRPGGRDGRGRDAGWRRGVRRDPPGGPLPGRPLRPAGGRDRPIRDRIRRHEQGAIPRRGRHAARRRGRRRATRGAAVGGGDPPLRPVPGTHARPRRRDDATSSTSRSNSRRPTTTPTPRWRSRRARRPMTTTRTGTMSPPNSRSPTTRPSCRTCSRASSRSNCPGASDCSRPRRRRSGSRNSSPCWTGRCFSSASGCATSRPTHARWPGPVRS